jgi:hypothetical protein
MIRTLDDVLSGFFQKSGSKFYYPGSGIEIQTNIGTLHFLADESATLSRKTGAIRLTFLGVYLSGGGGDDFSVSDVGRIQRKT